MQAASFRPSLTRGVLTSALLLAAPLPLMAAEIGGRVFLDGNRNASYNNGEPGMPTVTVRLTWAGPDGNLATTGDNQNFNQATDSSGNYNFTGLAAGNYLVDLDDATLPVGLAVVAGQDPRNINGVTAAQVVSGTNFALVTSGLNLTLWTVNEADPAAVLPRSGAGSPRLFCFTQYSDQTGTHQFIDYGRLVWRDSNGVIQTFAGGDESNAESLAIDTRNGDAYVVVNPATGGFTVPVLFKVNLYSLRANAAQVVMTRIGEVRDAGGVAATSIEGIAFDEPNNLIYAVNTEGNQTADPERLLQIDPATAQWSSRGLIQGTVGATSYALTYTDGLEVVPVFNAAGQVVGGQFYGYDQQDNHLYQINPVNGAITALLNTVADATTDIETIAWDEQAGRMISVDNGRFQLATIPLDGSAPVVMSTYVQQGLANNAAVNDLEGAGFFLRGAFPLGTLGNHVWNDTNGNGRWDTGEPALSGVTVDLYFDADNNGDFSGPGESTPYATTTTNAQGFYEFPGLQAGRFRIGLPVSNFSVGQPLAALTASSPVTNAADDRRDADDNGIQSAPGQQVLSPAIVLTEGEIDQTVDFGMMAVDFGDAPASYPVTLAAGGAWHAAAGPMLGASRDTETDGQPSADASAEGADDDGVTVEPLQAGIENSLTVNASSAGFLDAWVDWNRDGDWDDAGEQVAAMPVSAGNNLLLIDAPLTASPGISFARFRISSAGGLTPGGGAADGEVEDYQFTILGLGSLSGTVWEDTDNDGYGDVRMASVTLTLLDSDGVPVDGNLATPEIDLVQTTTDGSGNYQFSGLVPGSYGVSETQPVGYLSVGDADAGDPDEIYPIPVLPGANAAANDFVEEETGAIGGNVLTDINGNGTPDFGADEVLVRLFTDPNGDGDPADGVQVDSMLTGDGWDVGEYRFTGLAPGDYVVVETQPVGLYTYGDGDTTDEPDDAVNVSQTDNRIPVSVLGGEFDDGNDFVEQPGGTISGTVSEDANHNNSGETGISGVTVRLYSDPNGDGDPSDGVLVFSTETDGSGGYTFTDVPPGSYVVVEMQPAGYFTETDGDSSNGADDAANTSGTDNLIPVAVAAAEVDDGNNFVEERPATISGFVRADADNDGAGDGGIGLVTVRLFSDPNGDGDPADGLEVATADTAGNGSYQFTGIVPGSYVVVETQPAGWLNVSDGDLTDEADDVANADTGDDRIPVTVFGAETDTENSFVEEAPGSLTGRVMNDVNNDNLGVDGVDTGIEGVELLLVDEAGDPIDADPLQAGLQLITVTTDIDGRYRFDGLRPGIYGVIETQPSGYLNVGDVDGDDPSFIYTVNVVAGAEASGNDFLEELPGSFSGTVWADTNNDNTGDTGIDSVLLTLLDASGNPVDGDTDTPGLQPVTNLTAPDGTYSFTDLAPGTYGIAEIQPSGWLDVSDSDGGVPNRIYPILVIGGLDTPGNDFVEEQPVGIGGTIYADTNANGFRDGGEPNAPAVLVQLLFDANNDGDFDDAPENVPVQSATATGGNYAFTDLPPGNYQVVIPVPPAGLSLSSPSTSTADDQQDDDDNGIQAAAGGVTRSPLILLLPGSEPGVAQDGTSDSIDSTVDFAFTSPKASNWIAWQNLNPLGGQNNPYDNPDGDLNDNLIEFAFCYDPRNGVPKNPRGLRGFCLLQDPSGGFYAEVIRPAGFTGLAYYLEYTGTLSQSTAWTTNDDLSGITPIVTPIPGGFESVRWNNLETIPELSNGQGYARIRVEELDLELQAWTEVQGWLDHSIESQCETYSNPFLKKEVFSGTADAGSPPNAISVANSATNINVAAQFAGKLALYVEVIDGPLEGHRFAVNAAASTASVIALLPGDPMNTLTPIPDLSGALFVVREAWRFAELFPATVFRSGPDLNNSDNILTFSQTTQTWTTYFLADLGGFGTYWVNSTDISGPPPVNQNNRSIDPAQGIYFHRRGAPITVPLIGIVRENDFRCPLVTGLNLTGCGYPLDQSYASRAMTLPGGFDGDTDIRKADQVLFWKGDSLTGAISYNTFFLLDGGPLWQRWVSAEDNFVTALDNTPAFKAGRAAFIKRTAGLQLYRIPAPWTPDGVPLP